MSGLVVVTAGYHPIQCGECGGGYAIAESYYRQCSEEGTGWNCPYCKCGWGFSGRGENEKLRKKLKYQQERVEYWKNEEAIEREGRETEKRRAAAFKGHLGQVKRRVGNGVCPCCNRTFRDLARHMKGQHPEYAE